MKAATDLIPQRAKKHLHGTYIESLYNFSKYLRRKRHTFTTPIGNMDVILPYGHFLEKKADKKELYEPALITTLIDLVSNDTVFYDIGADIGYISKSVEKIGAKSSNIHAFEAKRHKWKTLKLNCPHIDANHAFVSDQDDSQEISIDSYVNSNQAPDIVKVDVEGSEYNVLRGMESALNDSQPLMLIEVHPALLPQSVTVDDIIELLERYNYTVQSSAHRSENNDWSPVDEGLTYDESTKVPTLLIKATPNKIN